MPIGDLQKPLQKLEPEGYRHTKFLSKAGEGIKAGGARNKFKKHVAIGVKKLDKKRYNWMKIKYMERSQECITGKKID